MPTLAMYACRTGCADNSENDLNTTFYNRANTKAYDTVSHMHIA